MKKLFTLIFSVFLVLSLGNSAHAYIVYLDDVDGDPYSISATILGDGTTDVDITLDMAGTTLGDISGFFFNYESANDITISGADIDAWFNNDESTSSGSFDSNVNLNGSGYSFDVGIQFGEPGIGNGKGDFQTTSFTLSSSDDIFLGDLFGARLMSVLDQNNEREDSSKLIGEKEDEPPTTGTVPEPASLMLFSSALIGAFVKKRLLG